MTATRFQWHHRIETASTEAQIIQAVRELLATLDAKAIVSLPLECQPPRIVDGDDVAAYALAFVRHGLRSSASDVTDELGRLIVHASSRLSKLAHAAVLEH